MLISGGGGGGGKSGIHIELHCDTKKQQKNPDDAGKWLATYTRAAV